MADGNATILKAVDGALDGFNLTTNGTMTTETIWATLQDWNFLLLEFKLVFSAIGIIYVGSHAALRRPPSAASARTGKKAAGQKSDEESESDDDDELSLMQGMELSDAVLFPVMAGFMLVGLYYLIQWLQDPEILNKILRWYMSVMSLLSLFTLYAHGFELGISFLFPRYWRGRDGLLRKVDQGRQTICKCDDMGNPVGGVESGNTTTSGPLPGILSILTFSKGLKRTTWRWRKILTQQWAFKAYVHGMVDLKTKIKFSHMLSVFAAFATTVFYTSSPGAFLSNVLGYGMCYGTLLLMSPTSLAIGSLTLVGLFFYDIIMVFYTPYMVTVATRLDVPIKLTFEAAARKSILGLGDIVLPGMMMAFALRLDLWLHYQKRIKYESTNLEIVQKDTVTGEVSKRSETKHIQVKAPYVNVKGLWADHFWSSTCLGFSRNQRPAELSNACFQKTYFHATVVGYSLGMAVTLAMLLIFKRGQPALLYLVPGVLGALYLTAVVRGELKLVWGYTEDGSIDTKDVVVDLDQSGKIVKEIGKLENGVVDTTKNHEEEKNKKAEVTKKDVQVEDKTNSSTRKKGGHSVFVVSLDSPGGEEV